MMEILYIIMITLLGFGCVILLRFKQLGMMLSEAVVKTIHFPFQIPLFHIRIFKMKSEEPFNKRLKILFMPILNLSEVLAAYAYACVESRIEREAILTLLDQVEENEKEILIKKLVEKGYLHEIPNESNPIIEIKQRQYSIVNQSEVYKMNLELKVA